MSNWICTICRDSLKNPITTLEDKLMDFGQVLTKCEHKFHYGCISQWLDTQRESGTALSCPNCYEIIKEGDIGEPKIPSNRGEEDDSFRSLYLQAQIFPDYLLVGKEKLAAHRAHLRRVKYNEAQEKILNLAELLQISHDTRIQHSQERRALENRNFKNQVAELLKSIREQQDGQ